MKEKKRKEEIGNRKFKKKIALNLAQKKRKKIANSSLKQKLL